ncbi:MAG: hypothetical protein ACOYXA_01110 [Bacteroidota bacterium]
MGFPAIPGCIYFKISLVGHRILLNLFPKEGDEGNHVLMNDSMRKRKKWVWL